MNKIGDETTKIFGTLTSGETGLKGKTVKLYYQMSLPNMEHFQMGMDPIGSVITGDNGYYEYIWKLLDDLPIGYYWIKAEFLSNDSYEPSSAKTGVFGIPNLLVIPMTPLGTIAALASMMMASAIMMLKNYFKIIFSITLPLKIRMALREIASNKF